MDQTLSLSQASPKTPSGSARSAGPSDPFQATAVEEEPESPGRSPRQLSPAAIGPDPLAEGTAAIAGVLLALITLLVPLATVVSETTPSGATARTIRTAW